MLAPAANTKPAVAPAKIAALPGSRVSRHGFAVGSAAPARALYSGKPQPRAAYLGPRIWGPFVTVANPVCVPFEITLEEWLPAEPELQRSADAHQPTPTHSSTQS
jgi:hypothetical protein